MTSSWYAIRLICTTAISLGSPWSLFTTLDWLLSLPVDHSWQAVVLKWDRESLGLVSTVFCRKIFVLRIDNFFLIKKINISNKMILKYKTMHILLTNLPLDCRGEGSSNRNASRDESVKTGDESVETRDESMEAGEKTKQSYYKYLPYPNFIKFWKRCFRSVMCNPDIDISNVICWVELSCADCWSVVCFMLRWDVQ